MIEFGYRFVFDISCYYAIISFFLNYTYGYEVNNLSFFLLLVTAFLNGFFEGKEKGVIGKLVRLLIPLVAFCWEKAWLGRIIFLLPWAYLVVRSFRENYHMGYLGFKVLFRRMLLLYFIPIAILVSFADTIVGIRSIGATVPYLIIFASMGIMLLQLLRHQSGTADKKIFEKYQMKQTGIFFFASFLLTVGGVAKSAGNFIYNYIVRPFAMTLLGLVNYTSYVIESVTSDQITQNKIQSYKYYMESQDYESTLELMEEGIVLEGDGASTPPAEFEPMDVTLFAVLFGVAIIVILFFILKGEKKEKVKQGVLEDEREEILDIQEPQEKVKKRFTSPRVLVRYYYKIFMKKAESEGNRIQKADTTEDISRKYQDKHISKDDTDAAWIKTMYRKARYSHEEITKEDAANMKKIVRKT